MLNDAEQRRPSEIESQLRSDDPAFVQRFDMEENAGPRRGARPCCSGSASP
jgi:hypothetical protein